MRVAITGAAGKLGQAVLRLAPPNLQLRLIDRVKMEYPGAETIQLEMEDGPAVSAALRGMDAVLHLAALPAPFRSRLVEVYRGNTMSTFLACQACQEHGIGRLVFISSLCYYGHVFRPTLLAPLYLPIDEAAPPRGADAYSLSKVVGEEIVSTFARATGARAASLRFPFLTPPARLPVPSDGEWPGHFWSYLEMDDAARLTWQALAYTGHAPPGHEAFVATADETAVNEPTATLLARYYPGVADNRLAPQLAAQPYAACYTSAKAKRLLGFAPTPADWRRLRPAGAA